LSRHAAAAKREGISYGHWIAKYRPPGSVPEYDDDEILSMGMKKGICPWCGKVFYTTAFNKIYCCKECADYARQSRKDQNKREAKKEKENVK
jgi:hypothetical protein